jgi:hypothetical protein
MSDEERKEDGFEEFDLTEEDRMHIQFLRQMEAMQEEGIPFDHILA